MNHLLEWDGSRIYIADCGYEKGTFYKHHVDNFNRPICYFDRITKD